MKFSKVDFTKPVHYAALCVTLLLVFWGAATLINEVFLANALGGFDDIAQNPFGGETLPMWWFVAPLFGVGFLLCAIIELDDCNVGGFFVTAWGVSLISMLYICVATLYFDSRYEIYGTTAAVLRAENQMQKASPVGEAWREAVRNGSLDAWLIDVQGQFDGDIRAANRDELQFVLQMRSLGLQNPTLDLVAQNGVVPMNFSEVQSRLIYEQLQRTDLSPEQTALLASLQR